MAKPVSAKQFALGAAAVMPNSALPAPLGNAVVSSSTVAPNLVVTLMLLLVGYLVFRHTLVATWCSNWRSSFRSLLDFTARWLVDRVSIDSTQHYDAAVQPLESHVGS